MAILMDMEIVGKGVRFPGSTPPGDIVIAVGVLVGFILGRGVGGGGATG